MKNIEACIFDLDGVIVDTAKYHYLAWKRLAAELGFDFTEHENELLKGVSRMTSLDILLDIGKLSFDEQTKIQLADKKNAWYIEYILKMTPSDILPGVLMYLRDVKREGYKMAIASASKNARTCLTQIGIESMFDAIVDGTKVSKAKPDPEVFLKAAEELGVSPEKCVVYEDAIAGVEAAIRAGMHCIGVGNAHLLKDAHLIIQNFDQTKVEWLKS